MTQSIVGQNAQSFLFPSGAVLGCFGVYGSPVRYHLTLDINDEKGRNSLGVDIAHFEVNAGSIPFANWWTPSIQVRPNEIVYYAKIPNVF